MSALLEKLVRVMAEMRELGAAPRTMEISRELYEEMRAIATYPAGPRAVPMFNGVIFAVKPERPELFYVKHYVGQEHPTIKGYGLDFDVVGARDEAETIALRLNELLGIPT